jgi:hypothetical protein
MEYYVKYSELMYRILGTKSVLAFTQVVMNTENIEKDKVKEIKVMRLPAFRSRQLKEVGDERQLMGRYSPKKCLIELYPLLVWSDERKPLNKKDMDLSKKLGEIGIHTIKTLIHEILHIKYKDEGKVKELTDKYFELHEKSFVRKG